MKKSSIKHSQLKEKNATFMFMGCLKLAHIDIIEPVLRCVWNSAELQKQGVNWYDYGFRFYDPVLGRFPSLDPKADEFSDLSPYNYASNNPVTCIDLWGLQGLPAKEIQDKNGNPGGFATALSSTFLPSKVPKSITPRSASISSSTPSTGFGKVKEFTNAAMSIPLIGAGSGMQEIGKFVINSSFETINDVTTMVTGASDPANARNAEGIHKNPSEITDAGISVLVDVFSSLKPLKTIKSLNASEFSSAHKGTKVLTGDKAKVGLEVQKTNIATKEVNNANSQSFSAVKTVNSIGNLTTEDQNK